MVSIYALINPITDKVFYIGASHNPKNRLLQHISNRNNSAKGLEITSIIKIGVRPEILILDTCEVADVRFWEEFYISLYTSYGFVLNQIQESNYPDGSINLSSPTVVRLPLSIYNDLNTEAKKRDRSLHWLILKLAKDFLHSLKSPAKERSY